MSTTPSEKLKIPVKYKEPLRLYTTFQLGGPCRGLITCQTPEQIEQAVDDLNRQTLPFILIGGGSNIVVADNGIDCFVLRYVSETPLINRDGNDLIVSGSTILDHLVQYALEQGLEGINYASGIPGTVGGAVVGNAGAFGKQIGDVVKQVTLLTRQGKKKTVGPEALGFSYRDSNIKQSGDMVLSVRLALKPGDKNKLLEERKETLAIRHEKHPDLATEPCAGSFFRNIEPTSKAGKRQATGWFLEQAGGKDLRHGGAYIFSKHANIIVKGKDCKAQDVYELSRKMAKLAKDAFNLDLVREVRFVGLFTDMPPDAQDVVW